MCVLLLDSSYVFAEVFHGHLLIKSQPTTIIFALCRLTLCMNNCLMRERRKAQIDCVNSSDPQENICCLSHLDTGHLQMGAKSFLKLALTPQEITRLLAKAPEFPPPPSMQTFKCKLQSKIELKLCNTGFHSYPIQDSLSIQLLSAYSPGYLVVWLHELDELHIHMPWMHIYITFIMLENLKSALSVFIPN